MSLGRKLLSLSRVKKARKQLAADPSIANYLALANEHARREEMEDAARVCEEGLTRRYGEDPPIEVRNRFEREFQVIDALFPFQDAQSQQLAQSINGYGNLSSADQQAILDVIAAGG